MSECSGNIYFNMYDLFTALFRLKANGLVLFLLFVFRLLLFVVTNGQDEPYYKKKYRNYQNMILPQSVLDVSQYGHCLGKGNVLC